MARRGQRRGDEPVYRLSVRLSKDLERQLKQACLDQDDKPLQDFVEEAIREKIERLSVGSARPRARTA